MTAKELIAKIQHLIDNRFIEENSDVILVGSGEHKTTLLDSIAAPGVVVDPKTVYKNTIERMSKGTVSIGFTKL